MRILFCCEFYAPSVGGIQEVMRQVAERLVSRGHEVTVATSQLPSRTFTELNGVRVVGFSVSGSRVGGVRGEVAKYQQFVSSGNFDLVMINMAQQWTLDALIPVLSKIRYRKVLIPCGFSCFYEPSYAEYYRQMPSVLGQFDHQIFHASDYRDIQFAKRHGLKKFSIIPNGASETEFAIQRDASFRNRLGISEDECLFLTVGAFTADKGHADLLRSYMGAEFGGKPSVLMVNANAYIAEVRDPVSSGSTHSTAGSVSPPMEAIAQTSAVRMEQMPGAIMRACRRIKRRVFGREPADIPIPFRQEMTALLEQLSQPGTNKRVMMVDLPRPDLVQAYMNADLFLFASRIEYSPLVLFESAAAGTPFLSAQVGNAEEIARWTGAGVIGSSIIDDRGYTRIHIRRFAKQWAELIKNRARRRELSDRGRQNWAARFTWERIAQEYENVFRRVCAAA